MDIIKEALSGLSASKTLKAVAEHPAQKITASLVAASLIDIAVIFCFFIALAVIDIVTRCIAMSAALWRATYPPEVVEKRGNLWNYIKWIPQAHHWRYIDSEAMRTGFCSKMLVYMLLILAAFFGDMALAVKGIPQAFTVLVVAALAFTEMLSVLENLGEAGVSVAKDLKGIVQKKKEGLK